jgi:hypothetical protein
MDDLTAFISARLDEDEAIAKAWQSPPWREDATHWKPVGQREPRYDNGRSETLSVIDVSGRDLDWSEAIQVRWDSNGERVRHISRHDPARVLREVAAKRAIVAAYEEAAEHPYDLPAGVHDGRDQDEQMRDEAVLGAMEDVARHLAAVWSDHPDYRAEWSPEPPHLLR